MIRQAARGRTTSDPNDVRAVIGVTVIDPDEAELCARLIARYAVSPEDGDLIADVLGLDEGVRTWSSDYGRVMRLADSIATQARMGSNCTSCGYKRSSRNHRAICGSAA